MGLLRRLAARIVRDDERRRSASIREWAEAVPRTAPISSVESRSVARVAGVVEEIRVRPHEGVPTIEAGLTDGSGTVTAIWLGRRALPGLLLGSRLVVEGRFGGDQPRLQIVNPAYEFAPNRE